MTIPDELADAFMFANTPGYLYRRMASTDFVARASAAPADAQTELDALLSSSEWSEDQAAIAYALVVALVHAGRPLPPPAVIRLPWARWIEVLGRPVSCDVTVPAPEWGAHGKPTVRSVA